MVQPWFILSHESVQRFRCPRRSQRPALRSPLQPDSGVPTFLRGAGKRETGRRIAQPELGVAVSYRRAMGGTPLSEQDEGYPIWFQILRIFISTFFPVTQLAWVFLLTSFSGMTTLNFILGAFIPFYGWYLIWERREMLFFLQ